MINNKLEIQDIRNSLNEFEKERNESNSRYLSWEHCITKFAAVFESLKSGKIKKEDISDEQIDCLSLNLAFYLASWGMMRGSTELLQYDYKIHIPCVKRLLEFANLFCMDFLEPSNIENLKELENLSSAIANSYTEEAVQKRPLEKVSDTLITKIIMGTFGIVPAYDDFVKAAVKYYGITIGKFNEKSFFKLIKFFSEEKIKTEITGWTKKMKNYCPYYTPMKVIDSSLWKLGKPITEEKKQEAKNQQEARQN